MERILSILELRLNFKSYLLLIVFSLLASSCGVDGPPKVPGKPIQPFVSVYDSVPSDEEIEKYKEEMEERNLDEYEEQEDEQ